MNEIEKEKRDMLTEIVKMLSDKQYYIIELVYKTCKNVIK